ncbi:MAG: PQQ-like beta-propeller repeat protein [Ruminococcaceae bacterium]|nr:PQQ-like beta-propeller repeat protein [Oscillospiraceae bacterium]
MFKRIISAILICAMAVSFTACSENNTSGGNIISLTGEENIPTNNPNVNYGGTPIMKTENGYYFFSSAGSLMFYDNQADQNIYLCNKPECLHDGNDFCVSTKDRLSRRAGMLYNDHIYIVNVEEEEEKKTYKLLQADLYGSELSEICTFFSAVEGDMNISTAHSIIHKGKMFVTVQLHKNPLSQNTELNEGIGMKIFMIDLKNGSYQEIQIDNSGENEGQYVYDGFLSADKDNIYYLTSSKENMFRPRLQCYNITTGETKVAYSFERAVASFTVNNDKLYYTSTCYKDSSSSDYLSKFKFSLYSVDLKTGEEKTFIEEKESEKPLSPYVFFGNYVEVTTDRNYLYVCTASSTSYSADLYPIGFYIYDFNGKELAAFNGNGQFDWENKHKGYIFNVLDGVAYLRVFEEFQQFETYSCSVEDILNGKEKWTRIFDYTVPTPPESEEDEENSVNSEGENVIETES